MIEVEIARLFDVGPVFLLPIINFLCGQLRRFRADLRLPIQFGIVAAIAIENQQIFRLRVRHPIRQGAKLGGFKTYERIERETPADFEKQRLKQFRESDEGVMEQARIDTRIKDVSLNLDREETSSLSPPEVRQVEKVVTATLALGSCYQRHRHQEFLRFLNEIDQTVPADMEIHPVMDNYGAHKTERIQRCFIGQS